MFPPFTQNNKSRLTFPSFFFFLWCLVIITHNDGRGLYLSFDSYFFSTILAYIGLCFSSSAYIILIVLIGQIVACWLHMPIVDNHYFFMAIVSLILSWPISKTIVKNNGRLDTSVDSIEQVLPTVRWLMLLLYFFAVFHKLNFGFFDPDKSCAITWIKKLNDFSLIINTPQELSISFRKYLIGFILFIELMIPLCFLRRKSWWIGLLIGITFHLMTHVRHFPITMFAMYFLFIPSQAREKLLAFLDRLFLKATFGYLGLIPIVQLQAIIYTLWTLLLMTQGKGGSLYIENSWIILASAIFIISLKYLIQNCLHTENQNNFLKSKWNFHWPILAVFFFNCLSPYTGLKTSTSMAMYSNLNTVFYQSNHLLIKPGALKLFDFVDEFIVIRRTNVQSLQKKYAETQTPVHVTDLQNTILNISHLTSKPIMIEYVYKKHRSTTKDALHDQILMKPKTYLYRKCVGIRAYQPDMISSCEWL